MRLMFRHRMRRHRPPRVLHRDGMQDLVGKLKCTVQLNFDPARRLLDRLTVVVWTPTLDERESGEGRDTRLGLAEQ